MTTFTLIAFTEGRSGWYDRCNDYNDGNPSELDISYFDDPKECGFMWAYTERQYETIKLLIDGRDPYEDQWDAEGNKQESGLFDAYQEAEKYRSEQSDILKAEHDKREQEKREAEAARKAADEAQRKAKLEQAERAQLENLQRKYGGRK